MLSVEGIQSAGNTIHQLLEARTALGDANLLHLLQDLGHPYGVLLGSLSQNSSDTPITSYGSGNNVSSQTTYREISNGLSNTWLNDVLHPSAEASLGEKSYNFSSFGRIFESYLSSLSISSSLDRSFGDGAFPCTSLPSTVSSGVVKEIIVKSSPDINKNSINFGTVSLNLTQFKGRESFVVKTPQGEPVAEILPGNPLAFLHLNRQSAALRQLSPLERIQTMIRDLQETFSLIDSDQLLAELNPKQQAVLTAARSAVIVGISHLVPLFRRRTGLPFWKLDVLPQAIQQLHRLDSQAVSNQFGGHREVKAEDVEMMVITPQMRQQLAAAYA